MKNYFKLFLAVLLLFTVNISYSQNSAVLAGTGAAGSQDLNSVLGIGNDANNNQILNASGLSVGTATVGTSSIVDIASTTSGLLIPRMTTVQRDAIGTPATGLMVYNTTDNAFNFYNGTVWTAIGGGGATTLAGLTDVNTATPTAGNFLVGDGVDFESIAMSGDVLMTGAGVVSIQANAVQVADVDFINTATATAGNVLVADGVDYESVAMSGDASIAASGALTVTPNAINQDELAAVLTLADADYLDLSAILHDDAALQGFRLPQIGATPTNLGSGEGFIGWDETNNTLEVFDGTAWTAIDTDTHLFSEDKTLAATRTHDLDLNTMAFLWDASGAFPTRGVYFQPSSERFQVSGNQATFRIFADAAPTFEINQGGNLVYEVDYNQSSDKLRIQNDGFTWATTRRNTAGLIIGSDIDDSEFFANNVKITDKGTGVREILRLDMGGVFTTAQSTGDGVFIGFNGKSDANTFFRLYGNFGSVITDATDGATTHDFYWETHNNNVATESMRLQNDGQLQLPVMNSIGVFGTTPIGQVTVDATGQLDVVALSSGTNRVITANATYVAADNNGVIVADNTADAAVLTYTLNATPANGDQVTVFVAVPGTNGVTILRNGNNINGAAADVGPTLAANTPFILEFTTGYGWAIIN